MRRVVSLVLLGLLGTTQLVAQGEDYSGAPWRTSFFPYLSGGTNDGPVLNFRVRYWQAAEYEDRVTANAALDAEAGITPRGGRHAFVRFRAPQIANGWRFDTGVEAAREVRFGYFALGNDTEYNKDLVTAAQPFLYRVRRTRYRGVAEVTRHIRGPLMVALMGGIERARFTSLPGPSLFAADFNSDELKQDDVSGRLALIYDTRDTEYNTHQGLLLEAGAQIGSGGDGYTRLYTLLRAYLMPREGTVVAARIGASGMGGTPSLDARYTIPGWEREVPVLGGEYSHRSLDTGRLAGRHLLFGNLEVRHDLLAFGDLGAITLLAFTDAGRVFEEESFRLTFDDLKVGGGGGVALRILRPTIFTFNFAGGPDGFNFSVGGGWMF
ncbi:MAG TPA: BamA/TamA family outer membrane protein [Gemmatimonadales bacterium]|nr:BamA/TamA family outer membrane protein [Gemmatimonadales bacterium]